MLRWSGVLALLLLQSWALPVLADAAGPSAEDIKAAGEEFDQAKRAYKQKSWVEAAEHFEAADDKAPSAVALELAIRSREKASQPDRAAMLASLALTRHPDSADLVKLANGVLKKNEADLHKLAVHCTPACELVIGTKLVHGKAQTERTLYLPAGATTVHASWSGGRTRSAPVKAVKGGSGEVSFEAPPEEKPPEATPTPVAPAAGTGAATSTTAPASHTTSPERDRGENASHGWSPAVFFVGAGLTVVAGGVTIWSGLDTQKHPGVDAVKRDCVGQGESCPTYQDGLSRQRRTNVLIGVTAGLGVATGVIGAFLTDWSGGGDKAKKQASVEPMIGIGSIGARGRF